MFAAVLEISSRQYGEKLVFSNPGFDGIPDPADGDICDGAGLTNEGHLVRRLDRPGLLYRYTGIGNLDPLR